MNETTPLALDALRRVEQERLSFPAQLSLDSVRWSITEGHIVVHYDGERGVALGTFKATLLPRLLVAHHLPATGWQALGTLEVAGNPHAGRFNYRGRLGSGEYYPRTGFYCSAESQGFLASIVFGLGGYDGPLPNTTRRGVPAPTPLTIPDARWDARYNTLYPEL